METIGPNGGVVEAAGGAASVTIGVGALSTETSITVRGVELADLAALPPGLTTAGAAFAFTPHGLRFAQPVSVRLPYASAQTDLAVLRLADENDPDWEAVSGGQFSQGSAQVNVDSFSIFVVAARAATMSNDVNPIDPADFNGQGTFSNLITNTDPRFGVYAAYCRYHIACNPRRSFAGSSGSSTECLIDLIERDLLGEGRLQGLDLVATQQCLERALIEGCLPYTEEECFTPSTDLASDGACCDSIKACAPGLYCAGERGLSGVCRPAPGLGEACESDVPNRRNRFRCAPGLVCDGSPNYRCRRQAEAGAACGPDDRCVSGYRCANGTCQPRLPDGSACTDDEECLEDHGCVGSSRDDRACVAPNSQGENRPCGFSLAGFNWCQPGLVCGGRVCERRPVLGQPCDPQQNQPCADGAVCFDGVCEDPVRLLAERCAGDIEPGREIFCAGDLSCDPATQRCVYRMSSPGDQCDDDLHCLPEDQQGCQSDDIGETICKTRVPNGQGPCDPCWLGATCEVNGQVQVCAPARASLCVQ